MGNTTAVFPIVNGQTVNIPLPTDGSLVDSVLVYNYSPFLVQARVGTSNLWISAWMVQRVSIGNASGIACTAVQPVGGAANSSTGNITAAFILKGDDLTDVGAYPAPLFHVIQFLDIFYPDGDIAIAIGPGEVINFYDDITGVISVTISPSGTGFRNAANTGIIEILPDGLAGYGGFPGIYFFTANTAGNFGDPAWIQANPDSNANSQLGLNSGNYTSAVSGQLVRDRIFFAMGELQIAVINISTQIAENYIQVGSGAQGLLSSNPIITDGWKSITLANGWSNFGSPYSNAECRFASDGFVHLRGLLTTGTRTDGTIIGTLPAAYTPPTQKYLSTTSNVANLSASNPQIVIDTSGNLKIFGISAYSIAVQIVLDGLLFESHQYTQ